MARIITFALVILALLLAACGPNTIFLRPGLDTPAHHVSNGKKLLACDKLDAAMREFNRARELNPNHVPAYIGIGLTHGKLGDIAAGMAAMDQAGRLASTDADRAAVDSGLDQLHQMAESGSMP